MAWESQRVVKPHFSCSMRRAVGLPSTSVPLSTVCAAQTWTNCPTFSPFLLFPSPPPFLCSFPFFPGFSPIAYGIFFLCLTLKTLARKTDMWNVLIFQWAKGEGGGSLRGWCPFNSIVLLLFLTLRVDGKNAAPECKSGPCLLLTFHSLIPDSNVKHLLSSTQQYGLLKYCHCSECILVHCLCLF